MPKSLRSPRHRRLIAQIADARRAAGLTQAQLAVAIGRPQSFIAKLEGGERRLEVLEFAQIAEVLGLAPGEFLMKILTG